MSGVQKIIKDEIIKDKIIKDKLLRYKKDAAFAASFLNKRINNNYLSFTAVP